LHFSDGGAGVREYDRPLTVGEEVPDSGQRYRIVRVEGRKTRGGFGHAWAEQRRRPREIHSIER